MVTPGRAFLRDFTTFKAKARQGGTVRVKDKEGVFLFRADGPIKSLLGAAKGEISFHADLTKPNRITSDVVGTARPERVRRKTSVCRSKPEKLS